MTIYQCLGEWIDEDRKTKKFKVYDPENLDNNGQPIAGADYVEVKVTDKIIQKWSRDYSLKRTLYFNKH